MFIRSYYNLLFHHFVVGWYFIYYKPTLWIRLKLIFAPKRSLAHLSYTAVTYIDKALALNPFVSIAQVILACVSGLFLCVNINIL